MEPTADHRMTLAAFVRARREALSPAEIGLSVQGRRRTPGLRREEVAILSGLSTTWVTWIEQAREIAMSADALSRLADALSLSGAERAYLFELGRRRDPRQPATPAASNLPAIFPALVDAIDRPAYVIDRLWQARCWNPAAAALLGPWLVDGEPSLLRYMFLVPSARCFVADWEERARRLLAEFRAETALMPDDPATAALIAELGAASPDFARIWHDHRVLAREGGRRRFHHPDQGLVEAEQISFAPSGHPDYKLVMLLPAADDAAPPRG